MSHVTVYAASAVGLAGVFHDAARAVGTAIAEGGHTLVYGGNRQGTMRTLAEAARGTGGDVVGITPQLFLDRGLGDDLATELVVTADMAERKQLLEDRADGFVVLPGGFGTLEEVFQTTVGRQLGYHAKPIVLVDLAIDGIGFWQPLLALLDHVDAHGMTHDGWRSSFHVTADPVQAVRLATEPAPSERQV